MAPTRELAAQIAASAAGLWQASCSLSVGVIFGGVPNGKSVRTVARGLDVLVATPGRLLDLIDQRALSLRELEILVLDEADQMLDLGFIHALKRIVALVPPKRQTLFFSATMPRAIKELADKYLTNPAEVSVTPAATTVDRVEQSVTMVNQAEKTALLAMILQGRRRSSARWSSAAPSMAPTRSSACSKRPASPPARSTATRARPSASAPSPPSRAGDMPVLIATDIAARGIDIPGVSHVVNFDLPDVPEQYVHRIGRTARAGADGIAIAFCSHDERGNLRDIERTTRQKIPVAPLPADFMAQAEAFKRLKPAPKAGLSGASGRIPSRTVAMTASSAAIATTDSNAMASVPKDMPPIARTRRMATASAATIARRRAPKAPAARSVRPTGRKRIARRRPNRGFPSELKAVSVPRVASPSANSTAASRRPGGGARRAG